MFQRHRPGERSLLLLILGLLAHLLILCCFQSPRFRFFHHFRTQWSNFTHSSLYKQPLVLHTALNTHLTNHLIHVYISSTYASVHVYGSLAHLWSGYFIFLSFWQTDPLLQSDAIKTIHPLRLQLNYIEHGSLTDFRWETRDRVQNNLRVETFSTNQYFSGPLKPLNTTNANQLASNSPHCVGNGSAWKLIWAAGLHLLLNRKLQPCPRFQRGGSITAFPTGVPAGDGKVLVDTSGPEPPCSRHRCCCCCYSSFTSVDSLLADRSLDSLPPPTGLEGDVDKTLARN